MMQNQGRRPLSEMSDEQLFMLYRSGRLEAFEELVRRFKPDLFPFLMRYSGNRAAAEDLFQESFLQVHLSADMFDVTKRFKPWLFTIAANKARDFLRKNKRQRAMTLSASIGDGGDEQASYIDLLEAELPLPVESAERHERRELVRDVVDALPDHLREILILAYFNQMAYKEIAEILEIPLGTVKSRLHAAVGSFAQLWKMKFSELEQG